MIKRLRFRFILFAMLALMLMQCLIVSFAAQNSYGNMIAKAHRMIAEIEAAYPEASGVDARYFVAIAGGSGTGNRLDLSHIRSVKREHARELVKTALDAGKDAGFLETFCYRSFQRQDGVCIVFLDRSYSVEGIKNAVRASAIFSAIGLGAMLLLLFLAAGWVTKPVKIAYEKQQQFVTAASHQLLTPLAVIKADADILLMEQPQNEWLLDMEKQVQKLTEMTGSLTALAKMDEQRTMVAIAFSATDMAEEVAGSYRGRAKTENISFSVDIEKNLTVVGDENMIGQLMEILLDNAFKYTADGAVCFAVSSAGKGVRITVTNKVENIKEEELDCFFDRFYRGKQSAESGKYGHGLGLSIAAAIVERHRGKINARLTEKEMLQIIAIV